MGALAHGDGAADGLRKLDDEAVADGRRAAAVAAGAEGAEGAPAGGMSAEDGPGRRRCGSGARRGLSRPRPQLR